MIVPFPDRSFPPYSYVPGKFPHPIGNPAGHSFNQVPDHYLPLTRENYQTHAEYQWGIELFNHGYYWEAHEFWEQVWHACGCKGTTADYLKGLIKLAAAGVKTREGRREGVIRHASRGAELMRDVKTSVGGGDDAPFGLSIEALLKIADQITAHPEPFLNTSDAAVVRTLPALRA